MNDIAQGTQTRHADTQTARDIVSIFFLKKRVFVLTFLSVVLAALAVSLLAPPIYKTSAKLLVMPQIETPVLFDADAARVVGMDNRVDVQVLNTIVQLLKTPAVAERVVDKLRLAEDDTQKAYQAAVGRLLGSIDAEPMSLANIIEVRIKGSAPDTVVDLLNTYLDEFIDYHISVNQSLRGQLDFFDEQMRHFKKRYKILNRKLAEASRKLQVVDPPRQANEVLNVLQELEVQRNVLIAKLKALHTRMRQLEGARRQLRETGQLSGVSTDLLTAFPALEEMQRSITQMLINIQRARNDFRPNSKPVRDAETQYRNMRRQINLQMGSIIEATRDLAASREKEIAELGQRIEEVKRRATKQRTNTIALQRLQLEVRLAKENYELYASRREKARINLEKNKARFANIKVVDRPQPPTAPWFPKKRQLMALAVAVGLILAVGMTLTAYGMDPRVWTPHDLIARTDVRFLGSLTHLSRAIEPAPTGGKRRG